MTKETDDIVDALRSLEERINKRLTSLDERIQQADLRSADTAKPPATTFKREGSLEVSPNGGYSVEFNRHFDQTINEVWRTMTDPGRMIDWYADADVDQSEGGKIVLRFANSGSTQHGIVTQFDAPSVFEHMWVTGQQTAPAQPIPEALRAGNGHCGGLALAASVIRYELTKPPEGGTNLKLTHYVPMNPQLIPAPLARAVRASDTVVQSAPPDMVLASWEIILKMLDGALHNPGNRAMSLKSTERGGSWPWDDFHTTQKKYAQTFK
ncbi:SRPBCC domain-containing protein [Bradyrhizobium sp. AUGA SZCCT0431]|uniref:SRPBCC domain-containing protein n=1 Tax=Bradyrhizobium sp. AUGA SZCCT0431 TaxID=2807674 RepID=UPI001BAB6D4B|nr:SRPBCC domain-containing protein [Bradyrhizobium sp. AUGA SZCCT0431]MBR1147529.1 SRPBCC domain-containing protein [Bradyrhizobium sp. AUGA SZCCT0431]